MTLVTEKEAAEKWCPYSRVLKQVITGTSLGQTRASYNRMNEFVEDGDSISQNLDVSPVSARCIGSRCMAWRWKEQPGPRGPADPERDDRGWCGAFGKVEP